MAKTSLEKLPPQNIEAEQSLLGCLLIDKNAIIKILDIVNEYDFYKDSHSTIFSVMKELYAKQEPIDILSLTNRLEEKNLLEKVGGRTYLATLSNSIATSSHVTHYAQIIQKKATLRRLLEAAAEMTELGYKEDEDVEKILDEAEQKLFQVT
ncbi:replicative DNA helicase, partial [Candidatus Parcubacteria bacterium]